MINDHNNRFLIGAIFLNKRLNAYACYITEAIMQAIQWSH